ncbi:QRFP-like peptide receptor [Saccoglossus kowalevskii]|uniref:Neuropeptide FF receptor 2-like n=1 Tax=Saccoglossus kowalevskii TaxID=10224 RepID=A0ABM0MZQ6_SACKO|nr:PREDICTED: neuropeptide FF receptor 2-like [Saccoglossus kowalevskii]
MDEDSESYDYYGLYERAAKWNTPPTITITFGVLFIILIIAGNIWVIVAVFRQPKLRGSATNVFIVSLSVSDFMVAIFFIPYHVAYFAYGIPISDDALCKILGYLHWAAQCGTTFSLICIGVDRYRAIVQPMKPKLTIKHALIGCTLVWVCALGYSSFKLAVNGVLTWNETLVLEHGNETVVEYVTVYQCHVIYDEIDYWFRLADLIVMYVLPLFILTVLYSIMVFSLWFSKSPSNSGTRRKKRAVKMLSFVVLQFALTWLPNHVLQFYFSWAETFPKSEFLFSSAPANLAIFVFLCNSWINPILYAYFNENFRKEFRKLFPCFYKCRKNSIEPEDTATTMDDSANLPRTGNRGKVQVSTIGNR